MPTLFTRRRMWKPLAAAPALFPAVVTAQRTRPPRPNVIVLLTDDQGYGDLSCHGNPVLQTPHLDRLHRESIRLTDFHVAPMCAPTRSQLFTGVDCVRNAAMATCLGRSVPRREFPFLPEAFAAGGYRTGLFGKWHAGYSYPFRPMDRGFQDAVYHQGFGLTGMGHHWNCDYFDPYYFHNGALKRAEGFCTDFWFDQAMGWMRERSRKRESFFCCLPVNAPHFPYWVHEKYSQPYEGRGPAEFYGLIANLDENVGRLERFLSATRLRENTILVYMTDNGTVESRHFNAGMTGGKTRLEEGGHRVPCFVRWPAGGLRAPGDVRDNTQIQDMFPTLLELCGLPVPAGARFDGESLAPLLRGAGRPADRMLVVQFYQQFVRHGWATVMWNHWRLVRHKELYDVHADLAQRNDLAARHPEIAARLRNFYDGWWAGVEPRLNDFVPAHIGSARQNPVPLCSSEWEEVRADNQHAARTLAGGPRGGPWNVLAERDGAYAIALRRFPAETGLALGDGIEEFRPRFGKPEPAGPPLRVAAASLRVGERTVSLPVKTSDPDARFRVELKAGRTRIHGWFQDRDGQDLCGAYHATVTRL